MNAIKHIDDQLDDYIDDQLSVASRSDFDRHVQTCRQCADLLEQMIDLRERTKHLPASVNPPVDLWPDIESHLTARTDSISQRGTLRLLPVIGLAVAAVLAVSFVLLVVLNPSPRSWDVLRVTGQPSIDQVVLSGQAQIESGQTIVTDSVSRAAVAVGSIGTVDVLPETIIQVVSMNRSNHRFRMTSGTIQASITAPPRLFFVETPSALAIDLGCEYTLRVDSLGRSHLDVSLGYVELEHPGRSSVIPEGYKAVAVPDLGPTVAIDTDAPAVYTEKIISYTLFDNAAALDSLVSLSTPRDAVTLWLILQNHQPTASESRRLYDRLVQVAGAPEDVSFSGTVIARNSSEISAWQDHLNLDLTLMSFQAASKKKRFLRTR